ncbi:hypothetical protein CPB83DRAFT_855019 [Crepidotus variabilis]|uniref:BZIP domain-containing protein n=1 Tax=Crepidotus variabilis TaxID=179855 RepID=A0A9P6JP64_9AGAR|nr:hypothetical protein CPB83DRAFT_855019 [Crepidotus variabilis]
MHPPLGNKEDQSADYNLAQMSTLFAPNRPGMTSNLSLPETSGYSSTSSGLNDHNRSISLESAASLIQGAQTLSTMSRTHPSLAGFSATRGSPDYSYEPLSASPTTSAQRRERYAKLPSGRRRSHTMPSEDEESDIEPLDPDATEEEKKLHKRRQNTLAARRSRAKKAVETQVLREEVTKLRTENAIWKERALMMERLLVTHGLPCPNFSR